MRAALLLLLFVTAVMGSFRATPATEPGTQPSATGHVEAKRGRHTGSTSVQDIRRIEYVAGITCQASVHDDGSIGLSAGEKAALLPCVTTETDAASVRWDNSLVRGAGFLYCRSGKRLVLTHNDNYSSAPDCFRSCRDCLRDAVELGARDADCQHNAGDAKCSLSYLDE
ncbi:MAG: hypothetical protein M1832_000434 [Thelocarpon impressellum]|nr:MAG: hypothetical protein M1832_000434 [Thelocarpon impressellum]